MSNHSFDASQTPIAEIESPSLELRVSIGIVAIQWTNISCTKQHYSECSCKHSNWKTFV